MTMIKETEQEICVGDEVSATIYLNKLKEFSEDTFVGQSLDSDAVFHRTLQFIREILQMDCVFLAELSASEQSGSIRGILDERMFSKSLCGRRLEVLASLSEDVTVFHEDDDTRALVNSLFDAKLVSSGISVPIVCEDGPRGILAVCATESSELTAAKILFAKSMASVIALFLQSRELMPNFDIRNTRLIIEAKQVWEETVDTLNELVVVLDEEAHIIRVNMAIQHWALGTVNSHINKSVERLICEITPAGIPKTLNGWQEIWFNLPLFGHIAWEAKNESTRNIFRFSLRSIGNGESNERRHKGFAVLVVENITKSKHAEEKLKNYNTELEDTIRLRNLQLEDLNQKLTHQLEMQKRNKEALLKSEAKYIQLFNNTLAAVCLLNMGRIQFCNDQFCRVFKLVKSELLNTVFLNLFEEEERGKILSLFADLDELHGMPTNIVVLKGQDGNGDSLWLEVKMEYLESSADKTIIINAFDVTPQKNIELSLRSSEERLQRLSCQLINAQENERKRLAMELHDGLGQSLSAIKYSMEELAGDNNCCLKGRAAATLRRSIGQIRQTIEDTRRMAMDLRPSILDDLGIISTINWFCRQFEKTYKGIKVEKDILVEEKDISESRKIVIYRILQEALNNIAKHANASKVAIALQNIDEIIGLSISDDGIGINKSNNAGRIIRGMGINSMQERVELSGGSFRIYDNIPHGTTISIRWSSENVSRC